MAKLLLGSSFGVLLKKPSTCFIASLFHQIFDIRSFFLLDLFVGLWETFGPRLFGLLTSTFSALASFSPIFHGGIGFISI